MTDEESGGVPRRRVLGFIGGTLTAGGVSLLSADYIVDNILTPDNSRGRGDGSENGGPDPGGQNNYGDWRDEIPSGCELPESYADEVETYVEDIGMDSSRMDEYVDSGRVGFERDGSELGVLVHRGDDGQYDDDVSGNFEHLCG